MPVSWYWKKDELPEELIGLDARHFIGMDMVNFSGDGTHMSTIEIPGLGSWTYKP